MSERSARLFPAGPAPFEVRLTLGESGPEPVGNAAGATTYRASLVTPNGTELARLLLTLAADVAGRPLLAEEQSGGAAVEEHWRRARTALTTLAELPSFQRLVLPAGDETAMLPPTLVCPSAGALPPIPCPACLTPLGTCRDDAALAAAGLPQYGSTAVRLLSCPACAQAREPRFWHVPDPVPAELAARGVGGLDELLRGIGEAISRLRAGEGPGTWPCSSCTDDCPLQPTTKRKASRPRALTWHDVPFLLLCPDGMPFDEVVEALGGADPAGERSRLLLYPADGSGLDAVESAILKLTLVLQAGRALREHHARLGRPYLDLQPGNLLVSGAATPELPAAWSFQTVLCASGAARTRTLAGQVDVAIAPPEPREPFAAPAVCASALIAARKGELLVARVVAADNGRFHLEGRLVDRAGIFPRPTQRDRILVTWPHDLFGTEAHEAVLRLDPRAGASSPNEVRAVSEPIAMDAEIGARLVKAANLRIPEIRYRVFPGLGVAEDLHSLAVLLLRTLLVDDRQGLEAVGGLVDGLLATLETEPAPAAIARVIAARPEALARSHVFFRQVDRAPERPNAIPARLWEAVLATALGWVVQAADLAAGRAPLDEAFPAAHLDRAIDELQPHLETLRTILLERQRVNAEVRGVIAELTTELEA